MTFVRNVGITVHMQRDGYQLVFVKKEKIAKDTFAFYFLRPSNGFDFLPGQYVSVKIESKIDDSFHDFSIASSPFEKKYISIVTKIRETEFKRNLLSLQKEDKVWFSKPSGGFIFEDSKNPKVFLAGGIGIVPLFNMIRYTIEKQQTFSLMMIASFSSETDIFYATELAAIQGKHPHVRFVFTITGKSKRWRGEQGRISKNLLEKHGIDIPISQYYLAGSPEFVIAMEELLEEMDVNLQNVKMEQFTGY